MRALYFSAVLVTGVLSAVQPHAVVASGLLAAAVWLLAGPRFAVIVLVGLLVAATAGLRIDAAAPVDRESLRALR